MGLVSKVAHLWLTTVTLVDFSTGKKQFQLWPNTNLKTDCIYFSQSYPLKVQSSALQFEVVSLMDLSTLAFQNLRWTNDSSISSRGQLKSYLY